MTVRSATSNDIDAIACLETQSFSDAWSKSMISACLSNQLYDVRVLDDGDDILGYYVTLTVDECELLRICIKQDERGKGLANILMQDLLDSIKAKEKSRILLEVRHTNEQAIGLYKKFGFLEFGVRKNYYGGNVDARLFAYTKEDGIKIL